jgi:hypothetical protein
VWLDDALCRDDLCLAASDGRFLLRDQIHLSHEGSAAIGKAMDFYGLLGSNVHR